MKALVYTGTERLELQDLPEPEPGPGECVVELALCGICGSDMHAWHGHDPRRVPPLVLGHEGVGTVRDGPLAGQRVAINPLMTCGTCSACRAGAEHLCPERALIGMRVPGAFADRVAIAERNLTVLSEEVSFAQAVLAEPLAVAVHAVRLGLARLDRGPEALRTVVLGGGAIGVLGALVLRERGARDLWIGETSEMRRLLLERNLGLAAYDPRTGPGPEAGSAALVIDAVGSGRSRAAASALAAPGGLIVHTGLQDSAEGLDTRRLTLWEIGFLGTYCYTRADFAEALSLLEAGAVPARAISEIRALADGPRAFRDIDAGRAPPKIALRP